MSKYSFFIKTMEGAARKAEAKLIRDFIELGDLQVSIKTNREFVTNADKRSEQTIFKEITKKMQGGGYNNFSFLMEESGFIGNKDAEFCFIIDPLDGTFNFMHGILYFSISIAMQHKIDNKKKIVAALIHSPITKETFHAEQNQGAFYTDANSNVYKMKTSTRSSLQDSLISASLSYSNKDYYNFINTLVKQDSHVRSTGSTSLDLAYLANGRYDAIIYPQTKTWDYAAGYLLVNEAGGFISSLKKNDELKDGENGIIATNSFIFYNKIYDIYKDFNKS